MATPPKYGKLIYHLTSINNLESILKLGLMPRDAINNFKDVADQEIIQVRRENGLNNWIPFHFFAGTPFDGSVQKSNRDELFVFITVTRKFAETNEFKIITQHPLSLDKIILIDYEKGLIKIDWVTMATRDYSDSECSMICMAECLTNKIVQPKDFHAIFVPNLKAKRIVVRLLNKIIGSNCTISISVNSYIFVK